MLRRGPATRLLKHDAFEGVPGQHSQFDEPGQRRPWSAPATGNILECR